MGIDPLNILTGPRGRETLWPESVYQQGVTGVQVSVVSNFESSRHLHSDRHQTNYRLKECSR